MKEIIVSNLAKIIKTSHISRVTKDESRVTAVSTDSRLIQPGDCFFAIIGPNFDGHNFLADAFAKGASCAVVSQDIPDDKFTDKTILKVTDTIKALGDLAAWYRKECNFKVVAITGSAGKTTTRQIVYHVLSKHFKTHQPTKNFNNFIGLPLSILAAPADSQILVLELATNHPGEIEYLSKICSPDIALITNVYPAHLAGFGSIEKIAEEKLSIAKWLCRTHLGQVVPGNKQASQVPNECGTLIINADCQILIETARREKLTFKTFSCKDSADFFATNINIGPLSADFTIYNTAVEILLPGRGNVENALAAWAICSNLGVSVRDFADAVKTINPVSMRTEILQISSLTVISDCYNANPASMKNALDILANLTKYQNRRSVFICGDMAELGDSEQDLHRLLGRQITDAGVNLLITLGNLAALAADSAKQARPGLQIHKFPSCEDLCNNLHKLIKDSDIILVKGSRINKLEMVVEKLKVFRKTI
jgi:UDP-N-acetylmuramoyl-tripeptide--D-alanyl-D-alanine ligase